MRQAQPIIIVFCKVEFTKIRFFVFFILTIRYISQKCIIFAAIFKHITFSEHRFVKIDVANFVQN